MPVTYGFYDSVAGDRRYNASQMSKLFEGIITDGVFQYVGGGLVVSANTGMNINVASGRAWLINTWINNDGTLPLTVLASEATLNRIDSVVIEANSGSGVRENSIKIIKGTPASSPVAPTLSNTATLKQLSLADIYVGAGVSSINAGNITNKIGTTQTPFITGIIKSLDTATLLAQYKANFEAWFANLQDQLDDNQAGNLQNQINNLADTSWYSLTGTVSYVSADAPSFVVNIPDDQAARLSLGFKIKLTQGTVKYFFVTAKGSPSGGNTPVTLYGGTDYTLINSAISNTYFSREKAPLGFPLEVEKWTVTVTSTSSSTMTSGQQVGDLQISVPIGAWVLEFGFAVTASRASTAVEQSFALSESPTSLTASYINSLKTYQASGSASPVGFGTHVFLTIKKTFTTKTTVYVYNVGVFTTSSLYTNRSNVHVGKAICQYL
jgi:hypothetical protein